MFTDLFSSLDCAQLEFFSIFLWIIPMISAVVFSVSSSWMSNPISAFKTLISTNSENQQKGMFSFSLFLYGLMFFLLSMNLFGLIPFVYGVTSNLWVASSLALTMWGLLILSGWSRSPKESAAHLAPAGAPPFLMPLLVLIETVSLMIRPLTLTVRLIANISAGHIVMSLIANSLVSSGMMAILPVFLLNVGYNMFEVFVCLIQSYIFSLLVKLYGEEHP
uniref:ATP synthase subunit a n=1 Tax=Hydatina physis TaxID=259632 RepID=E6Y176_9GAST|nr:ATP synthase F0 subunit 6 [Hydatina physis]